MVTNDPRSNTTMEDLQNRQAKQNTTPPSKCVACFARSSESHTFNPNPRPINATTTYPKNPRIQTLTSDVLILEKMKGDPLTLTKWGWHTLSVKARVALVKTLDLDSITSDQLKTVFPREPVHMWASSEKVFAQAITAGDLKKIQEKLPDVVYFGWITPKQAEGLDLSTLTKSQWGNMSIEVRDLLVKTLDFDSIDTKQLMTVFPSDPFVMAVVSEGVFTRAITADNLKKIQVKLPGQLDHWITPEQAVGLDPWKISGGHSGGQWNLLKMEVKELVINAIPNDKILDFDNQIFPPRKESNYQICSVLSYLSKEKRASFGPAIYKKMTEFQLAYLFSTGEEFNEISDDIFEIVKNKIPPRFLETLPSERFKKIDIDHYLATLNDASLPLLFNGREKFAFLNSSQVPKAVSRHRSFLPLLSRDQIVVFDFKGFIQKHKDSKNPGLTLLLVELFSDSLLTVNKWRIKALPPEQKKEILAVLKTRKSSWSALPDVIKALS